MPTDVNIQELRPLKNFGDGCPGCGSLLAIKLLLQSLDNIILVNATGSVTPFVNADVPFIHAGLNAAAVARGVARSLEKSEKSPKVVVFAGDGATAVSIASLVNAKDNVLYVCANDFCYTSMDHYLGRSFSSLMQTAYTATTCVSFPQDCIAKLKKACTASGFRFVEVLCPCPASWGYEPSNTIEVGRVAVETGIWPLYEVEGGAVNLTKRPNRLEPVEHFSHVQKKIPLPSQDEVNARWRLLTEGRLL